MSEGRTRNFFIGKRGTWEINEINNDGSVTTFAEGFKHKWSAKRWLIGYVEALDRQGLVKDAKFY